MEILWKSKNRKKSSTFAEYIVLSEAISEIILLTCLINNIFTKISEPVKIYEDNLCAVANYGNFTRNSKHIEVHYYYDHESVKERKIWVVKIDFENNIADILTKALGNVKFLKIRESFNLKL